MSIQVFIAMTGAFMTFTLAMLAGVWHFATIASGIKTDGKLLRDELHEFKLKTVLIDKVPEHERRLGILEVVCAEIPAMKLSIALIERNMQSINPPPRVRHPSRHDEDQ